MTPLLFLVVVLIASNAARRRLELPSDRLIVTLGAGLALAGHGLLALVADPLLDGLDVSAPNARIAAGFVVVVGAIVDLARRPDPDGPALAGRGAAVVPVAFPLLLRPDLGALAISGGADPGVGWAVLVLAVAMAVVVAAHRWLPTAVATPLARLLGVAAVGAGIATVLDGVFDV